MTDYTIRQGDTLSQIAKAYGTTVSELQKLNKIKNPNRINTGATLRLPEKTKTDIVSISNTNQTATDGTPSDSTSIRNTNAKNNKIAYDNIMANFDKIELPEGIDKEEFKEKFTSGYQAYIIDNDYPKTVATPADMGFNLIMNAFNGVEAKDDLRKTAVMLTAKLFPDDEIGGKKTEDLVDGNFQIVDNETGQSLALNSEIETSNKANAKEAYNKLLENKSNLPEGLSAQYLEHSYNSDFQTLPETETTPADFASSILYQSSMRMDNRLLNANDTQIATIKYVANLYPDSTIGGVKCSDLLEKGFSIEGNEIKLND